MIPGERRPAKIRVQCSGCRTLSPHAPGGRLPDGWTKRDASRGTPAARFCPACSADGQRQGMLLLAKRAGGTDG